MFYRNYLIYVITSLQPFKYIPLISFFCELNKYRMRGKMDNRLLVD